MKSLSIELYQTYVYVGELGIEDFLPEHLSDLKQSELRIAKKALDKNIREDGEIPLFFEGVRGFDIVQSQVGALALEKELKEHYPHHKISNNPRMYNDNKMSYAHVFKIRNLKNAEDEKTQEPILDNIANILLTLARNQQEGILPEFDPSLLQFNTEKNFHYNLRYSWAKQQIKVPEKPIYN